MTQKISRRSAIRNLASSAALIGGASISGPLGSSAENVSSNLKGRINHSVCKWCYPKVSLEDLCLAGKQMGLQSVELLTVNDFPTLKKHDLICAMVSGVPGGITDGLNLPENHDKIVAYYQEVAPKV